MYCQNVEGLSNALGLGYNSHEWRLFIDSSTKSLKAVLLHVGNKMPSIPLAHSTLLSENYETMKLLLASIRYELHKWIICGDLKVSSQIICFIYLKLDPAWLIYLQEGVIRKKIDNLAHIPALPVHGNLAFRVLAKDNLSSFRYSPLSWGNSPGTQSTPGSCVFGTVELILCTMNRMDWPQREKH